MAYCCCKLNACLLSCQDNSTLIFCLCWHTVTLQLHTWCILMSEVVTMQNLMMMTLIVSKELLTVKDRQTDRHTHRAIYITLFKVSLFKTRDDPLWHAFSCLRPCTVPSLMIMTSTVSEELLAWDTHRQKDTQTERHTDMASSVLLFQTTNTILLVRDTGGVWEVLVRDTGGVWEVHRCSSNLRQRSLQYAENALPWQLLQDDDAAATEQSTVDVKGRVLRGGSDQCDCAIFNVG